MLTDKELFQEMEGLKRFSIKLCGNRADAEDLLQNTLTKALGNREKFKTGSKAFSWLSRIMYNDFVTQYKRKTRFESQYDPELAIAGLSKDATQENQVMISEVQNAMNELNAEQREILTLVCGYEMSYEEVSKILKIPMGTVRSRLSRAREKMQEVLSTNDNYITAKGGKIQYMARVVH